MENNTLEKNLKFDTTRFWIILILIIIGIGLCVELGLIYYKTNFLTDYAPSFCAVSELIDCDGVAKTSYALSLGVPNAVWGLVLYLVMLMLLFVDRIQKKFPNTIFDVFENPRSYIAFLGILSFAISMILAFISIAIIKKICALCFCTYFINFFIAYAAKHQGFFFIQDIKTTLKDFIKGAKKYFGLFLTVLITFTSTLVYLNETLALSPILKRQKTQKEFFEAKKNKYAIKGNILGNKDAKVIINVYSDYNCPYCRVVNIMLHKIARSEDVYINEINFPLDASCNKNIGRTLGGHESSCLYSQYAIAAKKQDSFWGVANVLFDKHPINFDMMVKEFKKAGLNLDIPQLQQDAFSTETMNELQNDIKKTIDRNIMATPVIEINGIIHMGIMHYDDLIKEIRLAKKRTEN